MRNNVRLASVWGLALLASLILWLPSTGLAQAGTPNEPTLVVYGGLNPPAHIAQITYTHPQTKVSSTFDIPLLTTREHHRHEIRLSADRDWLRHLTVHLQWIERPQMVERLDVALLLDIQGRQVKIPLKSDDGFQTFHVDERHYNGMSSPGLGGGRLSSPATARVAIMSVAFQDGRQWAPTLGYYQVRQLPDGKRAIEVDDKQGGAESPER